MFRIEKNMINFSDSNINKIDVDVDEVETGGQDESPAESTYPDNLQREYLSDIEEEANKKIAYMMEDAQEEAKVIAQLAKIEAAEERKRAREEGYAEGSKEGNARFDKQISEKIREHDDILKNVLAEISGEWEELKNQLNERTADLAVEIVRKIIGQAEDEKGSIFTSLIKNALRQVQTDGKITIRVSQSEYERFFQSGTLVIELDNGATIKANVLRDITMNPGDLIIDMEDVTINAGVDSQLKYVELAFERAGTYEPD